MRLLIVQALLLVLVLWHWFFPTFKRSLPKTLLQLSAYALLTWFVLWLVLDKPERHPEAENPDITASLEFARRSPR